ncbi:MAG: hypothetical protein HYZ33_03705 [Ignavibacteriales bacterium]|nr:hypothetical protein [Ignavibacteriales bacterium]
MKLNLMLVICLVLLVAVIVYSFMATAKFDEMRKESEQSKAKIVQLEISLQRLHASFDSLKTQTPGLGEYMSTIQLHTAKLWFSSRATNWNLAEYELDELEETVEASEALHAVKNTVDISAVLQSMRTTQLPLLRQSIENTNLRMFTSAYQQTLAACNGCHQSAGYKFIHIVIPAREPVTNQEWKTNN